MKSDRPPLVTVGLPVYNGERFVGEAIESILGQDFTDFELLLADNGSTDSTSEICAGYASRDGRVRVHRSSENRGAAWNYNRCVDLARGRYFKWAAHDDVLEPSYLTRCVEAIEERPDVVLCYPRAIDIDENGTPIAEHESIGYATEYRPSERARSALSRVTPCLESFGVMRRATLLETSRIGGYTGSDRVLFVELALLGRFHEVPDVLFRHRQHPLRSVYRYADDRQRNAWFDPARAGRYASPKWRLLRGYAHAIFTARIPLVERACSMTALIQWIWAHRGTLGREAVAAVLHLLRLRSASIVVRRPQSPPGGLS